MLKRFNSPNHLIIFLCSGLMLSLLPSVTKGQIIMVGDDVSTPIPGVGMITSRWWVRR